MTSTIIVTLCILLLLAYIFDISSSKTRIPSVVLLLGLGWLVKQVANFFQVDIPDLSAVLPVLGTIGLVLIVLDGALELEFNKDKLSVIFKSTAIAILSILIFSFLLAFVFQYFFGTGIKTGLTNAIPFAIISSAIAIPSVKLLSKENREFVTYESSLSDIFGVIFFNFITFNDSISSNTVFVFFGQFILILVVSFIAALLLSYLLSKLKHNVKYSPIIILVILIYVVSKIYHLPALLFILLFGLFLSNFEQLKQFRFMQAIHPDSFSKEVHKFQELTAEMTFLMRVLFFMLFGFMIETNEILNTDSLWWAMSIVAGIYLIRIILLKILKIKVLPLLFIAPRGLITILLFISIPLSKSLSFVNNSLIIQVVVLSAFVMMFGLMQPKKKDKIEE